MVKLEIIDLHVEVEGKSIIEGITFPLQGGNIVAIIGPNGSGKSTLLLAIMGHPKYKVTGGRILLDGEDITNLKPYERARKGVYLAFQNPPELPGVKVFNFLVEASSKTGKQINEGLIESALESVGLPRVYAERSVHEGFSGGERKRLELAQAFILDPQVVMLDEPDSGLDIEGLRMLSKMLRDLASKGKAVLLVSHNPTTLEYVNPDNILVLVAGRLVLQGGMEVVKRIESEGFPVVVE